MGYKRMRDRAMSTLSACCEGLAVFWPLTSTAVLIGIVMFMKGLDSLLSCDVKSGFLLRVSQSEFFSLYSCADVKEKGRNWLARSTRNPVALPGKGI